ncbi:hypothetical protein Oscil6304_1823 [Oscillatoria acuminata PCC 6304]|uniref:Uncharacterized protein n=1 Tax=Oscillatoria acuminata PCC 6304 TaxID=56110 RepID=K9TF53_9CYAN|nr:hypothetical protein Oscil6304_1823 [Oscillatoria acuminata PCC 6304]
MSVVSFGVAETLTPNSGQARNPGLVAKVVYSRSIGTFGSLARGLMPFDHGQRTISPLNLLLILGALIL